MAVSTSSLSTSGRRCILAWASAMRMMLSRWRTAMGIPWLMADSLRSSVYTCKFGSQKFENYSKEIKDVGFKAEHHMLADVVSKMHSRFRLEEGWVCDHVQRPITTCTQQQEQAIQGERGVQHGLS